MAFSTVEASFNAAPCAASLAGRHPSSRQAPGRKSVHVVLALPCLEAGWRRAGQAGALPARVVRAWQGSGVSSGAGRCERTAMHARQKRPDGGGGQALPRPPQAQAAQTSHTTRPSDSLPPSQQRQPCVHPALCPLPSACCTPPPALDSGCDRARPEAGLHGTSLQTTGLGGETIYRAAHREESLATPEFRASSSTSLILLGVFHDHQILDV